MMGVGRAESSHSRRECKPDNSGPPTPPPPAVPVRPPLCRDTHHPHRPPSSIPSSPARPPFPPMLPNMPPRHAAGHSMGGGTAAMLTGLMREKVPEFAGARCWAIACPACMTLDLAHGCAEYVTSVVHGADIVPTFSSGSVDRLREEVRVAPQRRVGGCLVCGCGCGRVCVSVLVGA